MLGIFHAVAGRLKALFITHVALDLEAEVLTDDAVRKARLHRQANQLAAEGLEDVAAELRQRAGRLSLDRPLASVLSAVEELRQPLDEATRQSLPAVAAPSAMALATMSTKKRKYR